jgi:uncharacterized Rmd1/YagE family protein
MFGGAFKRGALQTTLRNAKFSRVTTSSGSMRCVPLRGIRSDERATQLCAYGYMRSSSSSSADAVYDARNDHTLPDIHSRGLAAAGTDVGGGGGGVIVPSHHRSLRRGRRSSSAALLMPQHQHLHAPHAIVPVSAIHAAQTIDLNRLLSPVPELLSTTKQMFGKNSVVIRMTDVARNGRVDDSDQLVDTAPRYVAVFRFGSIVFFNVAPAEALRITNVIKKFASEAVAQGAERKENFGVLVAQEWGTSSATDATGGMVLEETQTLDPVTGDYCIVPELDMNGVAVIGTIMAQTVALDRYSDTVDDLLSNFARINSTVSKTGNFTSTDRVSLFKTVAQNNSIVIDMISKVRIKDRSDTAWNLTKYETIHYGLKEEFVSSRWVLRVMVSCLPNACMCSILPEGTR